MQDGFDFLGQNVRRYSGGKVLLRPSKNNIKSFLAKIRELLRGEGRSMSAGRLIEVLNPKIRGWALYHRHASIGRTFAAVDHQIFKALWRWCRRRHANRPVRWIRRKYFMSQGSRSWIFHGMILTKDDRPVQLKLMNASDVRIQYHVLVRHAANPYDPAWEPYYEARLQKKLMASLLGHRKLQSLYERQGGRCEQCGDLFHDPSEWHLHHRQWRMHGGDETLGNLALLHANWHRQLHSRGWETE